MGELHLPSHEARKSARKVLGQLIKLDETGHFSVEWTNERDSIDAARHVFDSMLDEGFEWRAATADDGLGPKVTSFDPHLSPKKMMAIKPMRGG